METAKLKKLEEYASILDKRGGEDEKKGEFANAIPTYLRLVDVLLVMADASPSYPYWVKCTNKVETYQKKVKSLISLASQRRKEEKVQPG